MQAPEQEVSVDNVMTCSTCQPAETVFEGNPLVRTGGASTMQLFDNFDVVEDQKFDTVHEKNEECAQRITSMEATLRQKLYRPAWSTSSSQSSGRAMNPKTYKRRTASAGESSNGSRAYLGIDSSSHRLRTSKKAPSSRIMSGSDSDNNRSFSSDGNSKHNLTEKRYRSRLNDQFATLLSALPPNLVSDVDITHTNSEHGEKKVSKVEVLILAKERIRALEKAAEELQGENRALASETSRLAQALLRFNVHERA